MCDVRGIIVTGAADIAGSVLGLNPITGGVIATGVGVDYYSVCEKQYQQCVNDNINNGYYYWRVKRSGEMSSGRLAFFFSQAEG
jgi:hypothetical protein